MSSDTFSNNFVCFELPPPSDLERSAFRGALRENPLNVLHCVGAQIDTNAIADKRTNDQSGSSGSHSDAASGLMTDGHNADEISLNTSKLWANGKTLKIRFLEGSATLQKKVKQQAEIWLEHANIQFDWVKSGSAHIRIAFKQGGGSWSYVGTVNSIIEDPRPTMNFGTLNDKSPADEVRRVVLHEFGHALGCVHVHQFPLTSVSWDTERVYADCARPPNNWSRIKTDINVINRFRVKEVMTRKHDPDSIMSYQYPAEWAQGPSSETKKLNGELSIQDKSWIKRCYPINKPNVGAFSTLQVREWDEPDTSNGIQSISFEPSFNLVPSISMGLTWLDLDHRKELSTEATAEKITTDGFEARITSSPESKLFTGACNWLESIDDPFDLQTGVIAIQPSPEEISKMPTTNFSLTKEIVFPTKFLGRSAQVVIWFSGVELDNNHDWKISVSARNITTRGFTMQLDIGPDTVLRSAKVTWIGYPATRENIASGAFEIDTRGLRNQLSDQNSGNVTFADGEFSEEPTDLVVGISGLGFAKDHNLRLRLTHSDLTAKGFSWFLDTWLDSKMYGAAGQYLAIASQPSPQEFEQSL